MIANANPKWSPAEFKEFKATEADRPSIAELWNEAQQKFEKSTNHTHIRFTSTEAILRYGQDEMNKFTKWRHNEGKVDRLRKIFADNIDHIQTGTTAIVSAASGAFPPAVVIGTALSFVLGACRKVSADYDLVTDFYEEMNVVLQRITIIGKNIPTSKPYQNSLIDVFRYFMEMCGKAGDEIGGGRMHKWLLKAVSMDKSGIDGCKKKMETAIERLQAATSFAILDNTEKLLVFNRELMVNQEQQTNLIQAQTSILHSGFGSVHAELRQILVLIQQNTGLRAGTIAKSNDKQVSTITDGVATARKIENFFDFNLTVFEGALDDTRDSHVETTCEWMFEEKVWHDWKASNQSSANKLLAISGSKGSGKTHLATSAYEHLRGLAHSSPDTAKTLVGCVLFRDRVDGLQDMYSAMATIAIQIGQQSSAMCERINARIAKQKNDEKERTVRLDWDQIWMRYIVAQFMPGSPYHLQVIFDGVDELSTTETNEFLKLYEYLREHPANQISIVIFFRSEHELLSQSLRSAAATLRMKKQEKDYIAIIRERIGAARRLRNLDDDTKQEIVQKLEGCSDSILYVEYMLRNFRAYERRSSVLRLLKVSAPVDLDDIYLGMVNDYTHRLAGQHLEAARLIFMWTAFARLHLTLDEIITLLDFTGHQDFHFEEELQQSQLRRFLVVKLENQLHPPSGSEDNSLRILQDNSKDFENVDKMMIVRFWDRSMRDFFRSLTKPEPGLRTPASEAHRQIFIACSQTLRSKSTTKSHLLKYAAESWLVHHNSVTLDHHNATEQAEFLEATALLLHESSNLARNMIAADTDFFEIVCHLGKGRDAFQSVKSCIAGVSESQMANLSDKARSWFVFAKIDPQNYLLPVLRELLRCWLQTEEISHMFKLFWFARSCAIAAKLPPYYSGHSPQLFFYDYISKKTYMGNEPQHLSLEEVLELVECLPEDMTLHGQTVLYMTATEKCDSASVIAQNFKGIVENYIAKEQSLSVAKIVLGIAITRDTSADWFLGASEVRQRLQYANTIITESVNDTNLSRSVLARGYATLADVRKQLGLDEDSLVACAKVREYSGVDFLNAQIIQEEIRRMRSVRSDKEASIVVKNWTMADALAYMTSNFSVGHRRHLDLRYMAAAVEDRQFLLECYQKVVRVLEGLQSAAPVQIELAICHQAVYNDIPSAKKVLEQVLNGTCSGEFYALTNEEPEWALGQAVNRMSDMLYEEFRATTNPSLKVKIFETTRDLTSRRLAMEVNVSASTLLHHTITQARMRKRLGPAYEFQKILEQAFQTCYDSLTDSEAWNDSAGLLSLCKIFALMDGFEDEMAIAMSARFSNLKSYIADPKANGTVEEAKLSEDTDDSAADEDFDLNWNPLPCDGTACGPDQAYIDFPESGLYNCLVCSSCLLCSDCFEQRKAWNIAEIKEDEANMATNSHKPTFCGFNHKYVSGPMKRWKGLREGVIYIDGRSPVKFSDWLQQIKDKKWPEAWETFWLSEGLAG